MNLLHRAVRALLVAGLGFSLVGCCPEKVTLKAIKASWETIEPRYRSYVQADISLDDTEKRMRTELADLMNLALKSAKR
jgi:hypothetical protein